MPAAPLHTSSPAAARQRRAAQQTRSHRRVDVCRPREGGRGKADRGVRLHRTGHELVGHVALENCVYSLAVRRGLVTSARCRWTPFSIQGRWAGALPSEARRPFGATKSAEQSQLARVRAAVRANLFPPLEAVALVCADMHTLGIRAERHVCWIPGCGGWATLSNAAPTRRLAVSFQECVGGLPADQNEAASGRPCSFSYARSACSGAGAVVCCVASGKM